MKIHDSRDNTQRILTLTYTNVKQKKDGTWIGTPITVERSINDIIPVDKALSESMLNPNLVNKHINNSFSELELIASNDETKNINKTASNDETNKSNEVARNDEKDEYKRITSNDEESEINIEVENNEDINEKLIEISEKHQEKDNKKETTKEIPVRRSERVRKQRYNIHPDDIGNNGDENDENYTIE